jgi:flagellar biosynthesis protein FlhA
MLEDMLRMGISKSGKGQNLTLSPAALRDITQALGRAYDEAIQSSEDGGFIVLTAPEIRRHTRKLIENFLPQIPVLSYTELLPELTLETLSTATLLGIDSD